MCPKREKTEMDILTHCKRSTGTDRAWFHTHAEAVAFANDPANVHYHGDIAHFCPKCGFYHLSKPEWLVPAWARDMRGAGVN